MEKIWTYKFIVEVLEEKLIEHSIDINLEEDYWDDDEANNHLEYYKKEIRRVLYNETPILITCFSEEKDKLSQWRGYGDDGKGISIGVNKRLINLLIENSNIKLEKVIYNEKKQKKKIWRFYR